MQKLGYTGIRSFDQLKSIHGSVSGSAKRSPSSSRSPSDSITTGGFSSLKLTAENLVKEQASVRTDLGLANSKFKKSVEQIHNLEEKLRAALDENAKLKEKQREDDNLWQGFESKFSLTKTFCDQLNRTLTVLSGQVQDAEKDKQLIEEKLLVNSSALDKLNYQFNHLSLKLQSAEETIRDRDRALKQLRIEKEESKAFYRDQECKSASLIKEKDAVIKCLQGDLAASRLASETIKSSLDDAQEQLKLKEEDLVQLRASLLNLEREIVELRFDKDDLSHKLSTSLQGEKNLRIMVNAFAAELMEQEKQSLTILGKISQLCSMSDACNELAEQEKALTAKRAEQKYDSLQLQYLNEKSENEELKSANERLNDKVCELQRAQESLMVQHAEECHLSEERIRKLESEETALMSKKNEMEKLILELEEKVRNLSEILQSSEIKMKDLLLKMSVLESENKHNIEKLHDEIQNKDGEIDALQKEIGKHKDQVEFLEKQVSQIDGTLQEKEQLILQLKEREKYLEYQKAEMQALLSASDGKLGEAKKQYEAMLEGKQAELFRHLKEISQKNDQAINEIRKKCELEKQEIINLEMEKAKKMVAEMERNCELKLEQSKEELRLQLKHIQDEHADMINHMHNEQEKKEASIKAEFLLEIKHIQLEAENELKEKTKMLKSEHEIQIKALQLQHDDECKQLQDELDLQKSKEERQRALLEMQWKVMSDKPLEDQEVNSKQDYSVSSIHMMKKDSAITRKHGSVRRQIEERDSPYLAAVQSPMSALLKKVEKVNSGNMMDISKHSRKVTHHEYEVETTNEGTVTKRRKTSTLMFGDPRRHKRTVTQKADTPKSLVKGTMGGEHKLASNIGDLFTEGSLNPYADDPYAFG